MDAVRRYFTYPAGDGRATGYLDMAWLDPVLDALTEQLGIHFTVVAFQAYRDGRAGCDWHADTNFAAQAILSLGASRTLGIRPFPVQGDRGRGTEARYFRLDAGDLLFMPPGSQDEWQHCIPVEPDVTDERVSLVFRTVKEPA